MPKKAKAKLDNGTLWICKTQTGDVCADLWIGDRPRRDSGEWQDGKDSSWQPVCDDGTNILDHIIGDGKDWKNRPGMSIWKVKLECKKEQSEQQSTAGELRKLGRDMIDKGDRDLLAKAAKLLSE